MSVKTRKPKERCAFAGRSGSQSLIGCQGRTATDQKVDVGSLADFVEANHMFSEPLKDRNCHENVDLAALPGSGDPCGFGLVSGAPGLRL